jgi:hypothetical protein
MRKNLHQTLVAFTASVALLGGCLQGSSPNSGGAGGQQTGGGVIAPTDPSQNPSNPTNPTDPNQNPTTPSTPVDPNQLNLDARVVDYGQAARTASVKLVGDLPTADQLAGVTDATSYAAFVDTLLADPRFSRQMLSFFQDQFKAGGPSTGTLGMANYLPSKDTAPTYAAELVVKDMDFRGVFTATAGTCPTLDLTNTATFGTFTDADCPAQTGLTTTGVLTDPGIQSTNFSNMAMRRVRWTQETFLCSKFPAEFSATPVAMGASQYVSPYPFASITGGATAKIDFQDTSAVICANCHETINRIAPMFAQFDSQGAFQSTIQVVVPVAMNPKATRQDWLPDTTTYAYRFATQINTLDPSAGIAALGAAMAADPTTAQCQVSRVWNWAMDKGDIVNDLATVPSGTTTAVLAAYTGGGYKLKAAIKATFTADDFVKF